MGRQSELSAEQMGGKEDIGRMNGVHEYTPERTLTAPVLPDIGTNSTKCDR
jgi:hypothetical protein